MDKNSNKSHNEAAFLKSITIQDFQKVGLDQIAYIREIDNLGKDAHFSIHAADGSQISIMDTYDMALMAVQMSDLHAVTLH